MSDLTVSNVFVILCDWRGRVVWMSPHPQSTNVGELAWEHLTPGTQDRAKEAFRRVAADGHRAGAMVDSIRANFRNDERTKSSLDVNELIQHALTLERSDLQKHRISVQTDTNQQVRQVTGDRIQLQQVLLNLIANAIDSMAGEDEPRILSVKSEVLDSGIMVAVADSGKGIGSQDVDRIFNPLFTTKSDSMGMGLSICRSVIEAHEGRKNLITGNDAARPIDLNVECR